MQRYAIIRGGIVDSIIPAAAQPPNGVLLGPNDIVYVGDTYADGVFTPRPERPEVVRARAAAERLRTGRAQLRAARQQARQFADGTASLTNAQLTTAARSLAGLVAGLAQTLLDLELVVAASEDDGAE